MRKSMKILTISALALGFAAGCSSERTSLFAASLNSTEDVYAFSALSTTNLLASLSTSQAQLANNLNQDTQGPVPSLRGGVGGLFDKIMGRNQVTLGEEEMAEIGSYVGVFESLLTDGSPIESTLIDSDDENYTYKMTITTKTIDNTNLVYTMYYNEVVVDTGEDVELEQMDDLIETNLEGIMIVNDLLYTVVGQKVVNDNRSLVTFTSKIDDNNYVRIHELVVNNRRHFTYSVVADGELVSQSKVRFAAVDNKQTIFLETLENGEKNTYRFTKIVKEDETFIHMMVGSGINMKNVIIKITIDEDTGEEVYAYYAGANRLGAIKRMVKHRFAQQGR